LNKKTQPAVPPSRLEQEVLALLATALRGRQLLLVWADVPFPIEEHPPSNPALLINGWQEAAWALPPLPFEFAHGKPWPLAQLPPTSILSLDPTSRVEATFRWAGVPLNVMRTRRDVAARDRHSLIKLGGDLAAQAGLLLSWDDVRAAPNDPDKAHLLREAGRLGRDGAVLVLPPPDKADLLPCLTAFARLWNELLAPALREAKDNLVLDPADFAWPAPLVRLEADLDQVLTALADMVIPPPLESAPVDTS
jgi:hypothetical protein